MALPKHPLTEDKSLFVRVLVPARAPRTSVQGVIGESREGGLSAVSHPTAVKGATAVCESVFSEQIYDDFAAKGVPKAQRRIEYTHWWAQHVAPIHGRLFPWMESSGQ